MQLTFLFFALKSLQLLSPSKYTASHFSCLVSCHFISIFSQNIGNVVLNFVNSPKYKNQLVILYCVVLSFPICICLLLAFIQYSSFIHILQNQ